jgi:hypothetical protein
MIPKILVYLENGPIQFGVAKYLQENLSCEIFGIINTNKGKKFYEQQNLIKFKKYWFIRDNLKNLKKSPDMNYLNNFETKYKIDLWKAISSDVIFLKYNKFHKFSRDEILVNIEQLCRLYEEVLNGIKPDFLVIRITDAIADHLLHLMCKSLKIKALILNFSRLGYRSFIANDVDKLDQNISLNYNKTKHSEKELMQYIKGYTKQQDLVREEFRNSSLTWLKASFHFFKVISNKNYQKYYAHKGRSVTKIVWNELIFRIQRKQRKQFLDINAIKDIDLNEKFVYFPLGVDPERGTLIPTPFYSNQLEVIRNIGKSLPIDYQLYVKEHPMQIINAWRNIDYYKNIIALPNVKLVHPSINNEELLKKCSLVITIVGTTALEATIYKKPSIIFGEVIFSKLPSVFKIKNIEDLPELIRNAINTKVNFDDLNEFVNIIINNSFKFDDHALYMNVSKEMFYDGYIFDVDIKIEDMERVLKNYKDIELVGKEYLKKIKNHLENKI